MTELPDNSEKGPLAPRQPNELLLEVVDEETLHEARERQAARVRLLWNKRRFLFRVTICGLILATAIAFLIPKSYESTAELMPPDQSSGTAAALLSALTGGALSSSTGGGLASMAESALGVKTPGDLFVGVMNSQTVQDDLIRKFDLQNVYGTHYIEDTRKDLVKHTNISEDKDSGIISITVTDHDPKRAAAMAEEYVNELNWVVTHFNTSSAHRERVFLDHRLKKVKANLEDAEVKFSQFASQKGAIDIPEQGKAMVTAAADLQGQLIATEAELQSLRQIYTKNNVRVQSLQAQVNELRRQLVKLAGKGANEKSSAEQLYPSLRQLPLLGVTYADLMRKMQVEEAVFEALTQEDELAKVQEAEDTPSVEVLDPPLVPQKKSFPPHMLIMAIGTLLSLVFGMSWVLGRSAWDAADPQDPRKTVAIEVWRDVHAGLPWNSHNGSQDGGARHWLRKRFRRDREDGSGD